MQNQIKTCLIQCDFLNKLPSFVLTIFSVVFIIYSYFYVKNIFTKADEIEKNIFLVKDVIDNMEYLMLHEKGPISQSVLDRVVDRERKVYAAELEYLKMKRQFLLDRIPLLGVLKK